MPFDPHKHHRRSIRLEDYDYSQAGAYFVTLVAWQRECLFGAIEDGWNRIRAYIQENPYRWKRMRNFGNNQPANVAGIMNVNARAGGLTKLYPFA